MESRRHAGGVLDEPNSSQDIGAVQIYPSTSFLDLPEMTNEQWGEMTKEQQDHQLAWEAGLAKACQDIYEESSVK